MIESHFPYLFSGSAPVSIRILRRWQRDNDPFHHICIRRLRVFGKHSELTIKTRDSGLLCDKEDPWMVSNSKIFNGHLAEPLNLCTADMYQSAKLRPK